MLQVNHSEKKEANQPKSQEANQNSCQRKLLSFVKANLFPLSLLIFQLLACFIYGFLISYNSDTDSSFTTGDTVLVSFLIILALIGFGLMNTYINSSSFSGLAGSFLIFVITVQHYFLVRAFWYKTGVYTAEPTSNFTDSQFNQLSFVNINQDPYYTQKLTHASLVDAIACSISLILAFSPIVGRIQFFEIFMFTLVGTFCYQLNNQIFFRTKITDIGYGMRVFLFGGVMGFFAGIILNKRDSTINNNQYFSSYQSKTFAMVGFIMTICLFPTLAFAGLYHTSINKGYISFVAPLNMYLALGAGVLGSFSASTLTYRKINIYDLIYTGLSGGIVYSSSADIWRNPTVPMTIGFIFGVGGTIFHKVVHRRFNKRGVFFTVSCFHRLIIPGVFSGIMSAILTGIQQNDVNSLNPYIKKIGEQRSSGGQGGFQLVGVALTLGIGLLAGGLMGLLFKYINKNEEKDQFNDNVMYLNKENSQEKI